MGLENNKYGFSGRKYRLFQVFVKLFGKKFQIQHKYSGMRSIS